MAVLPSYTIQRIAHIPAAPTETLDADAVKVYLDDDGDLVITSGNDSVMLARVQADALLLALQEILRA